MGFGNEESLLKKPEKEPYIPPDFAAAYLAWTGKEYTGWMNRKQRRAWIKQNLPREARMLLRKMKHGQ